jgi:ATP-dependent Clp protease ATP-binding subunit ClpX
MYDWIAFDMTLTGKFKLELWGRRYQSVPRVQVQSPEAIYKHLSSVVVGQEAAKQALAMAAWRHQLYSNGDVDLPKSSVLLVGPTGCGKTLLASELAKVMGVPFITFSATQLSANSYVGASVEDVLVRLLKKAGHRLETAQRGVVFLDEIDKLRNVDSRFTRTGVDTKGTSVQQELLVPLEGGVIQLATRSNSDFPDFDTRGVLFILGGAFMGLDDIRRVRQGGPKGSLGFVPATAGEAVATQESATYQPADLVEYGFLPELAGRIGRIVELSALTQEDYYFILDRFPDGLFWPWYRLYAKAEVKLDWHSTALVAMAKSAAAKGMGARGLKSQLEDLLMPALYKARALTGSKKVVCVAPEGQGWTTTFSASKTRAVAQSKGEARKRATRVAA